jgi:hypothetical protein
MTTTTNRTQHLTLCLLVYEVKASWNQEGTPCQTCSVSPAGQLIDASHKMGSDSMQSAHQNVDLDYSPTCSLTYRGGKKTHTVSTLVLRDKLKCISADW